MGLLVTAAEVIRKCWRQALSTAAGCCSSWRRSRRLPLLVVFWLLLRLGFGGRESAYPRNIRGRDTLALLCAQPSVCEDYQWPLPEATRNMAVVKVLILLQKVEHTPQGYVRLKELLVGYVWLKRTSCRIWAGASWFEVVHWCWAHSALGAVRTQFRKSAVGHFSTWFASQRQEV